MFVTWKRLFGIFGAALVASVATAVWAHFNSIDIFLTRWCAIVAAAMALMLVSANSDTAGRQRSVVCKTIADMPRRLFVFYLLFLVCVLILFNISRDPTLPVKVVANMHTIMVAFSSGWVVGWVDWYLFSKPKQPKPGTR